MDRLRILAIKTAHSIIDEEQETPGSQPPQTLELARHFLNIIGDSQTPVMMESASSAGD